MPRLYSGKELGSGGTNSIDFNVFPNGHSAFSQQKWPVHGAAAFPKDCMFKICEGFFSLFGKTVEHKLVQFGLMSLTYQIKENNNHAQAQEAMSKEGGGGAFKWRQKHTVPTNSLNRKYALLFHCQTHELQSGVSIRYFSFDDAKDDSAKTINTAIKKCSIGI